MKKHDDGSNKHDRVLDIYSRLMSGEILNKNSLATEYGVTPRSIQRDIDSIRDFYSNRIISGSEQNEIIYDRREKGYRLIGHSTALTNAELFTITKILFESRTLKQTELKNLITKLYNACLPPAEHRKMKELTRNELFHYVEPRHKKPLIESIWKLGDAVYRHKIVSLEYQKANGEITSAFVKPVGIVCSEYYFYLIAYIGDTDKKYPGYPTIYRVDRITSFMITDKNFSIPYKDRFEEGEFRAICAEQRPLVRLPAATWRSPTATLVKVFR